MIQGLVVDCKDAQLLGDFYQGLLNWKKFHQSESWYGLVSPDGLQLGFHSVSKYQQPTWPYDD